MQHGTVPLPHPHAVFEEVAVAHPREIPHGGNIGPPGKQHADIDTLFGCGYHVAQQRRWRHQIGIRDPDAIARGRGQERHGAIHPLGARHAIDNPDGHVTTRLVR